MQCTVYVWGSCKDDCKDDSKVLWEEDDSLYSPLKENLMRMLHLGKKISTKLVVWKVSVTRITYSMITQYSALEAKKHDFMPWAMQSWCVPERKVLGRCLPVQCVPDRCVPTLDRLQELDSHTIATCTCRNLSYPGPKLCTHNPTPLKS